MVQSSTWEANWFAASQEIPSISRNPKVHYRTHKPPPPVSILGQPNPAHIPTSHLLEFHPNITHPSTPRSPQWSLSCRFPHQNPIHPPLLTHPKAGVKVKDQRYTSVTSVLIFCLQVSLYTSYGYLIRTLRLFVLHATCLIFSPSWTLLSL